MIAPGSAAATTDHFTPLSARVLHPPEPVRGGDGRDHLVYELVLSNESIFPPRAVTVRKVIATAGGKAVATLTGAKLKELMEPFGEATEETTTIQPGGTAKVLMDVSSPPGRKPPRKLDHELIVAPGPRGSVELTRFDAAPTPVVDRRAIVLAPPLRGPGWVVINGCCDENTSHPPQPPGDQRPAQRGRALRDRLRPDDPARADHRRVQQGPRQLPLLR